MEYRTVRMPARFDSADESPVLSGEARLDAEETRVVGALLEKQMTTPDYYPMTLNSLVAACNQKSSRHPVMSYSESEVGEALERLKQKGLVYRITGADSRVPRFRHVAHDALRLSQAQGAVMCVLMLRGAQTVGEIRQRTGRMHEFDSLGEVEETLEELVEKRARALVAKLPRLPGTKDSRWMHLLADEPPEAGALPTTEPIAARVEASAPARRSELDDEVARLREELDALRNEFERFKQQF